MSKVLEMQAQLEKMQAQLAEQAAALQAAMLHEELFNTMKPIAVEENQSAINAIDEQMILLKEQRDRHAACLRLLNTGNVNIIPACTSRTGYIFDYNITAPLKRSHEAVNGTANVIRASASGKENLTEYVHSLCVSSGYGEHNKDEFVETVYHKYLQLNPTCADEKYAMKRARAFVGTELRR